MSVDLTQVRKRIADVKRGIYYKDPAPLKILNLNTVLIVLDKGWFMPTSTFTNVTTGGEYWELQVTADTPEITNALKLATSVEINGERMSILAKPEPRGVTKFWYIRLAATGETG